MKISAVTMVYRDYWALSQWYRHHGGLIGHENLFVVAHGHDPEIARICPKASIITVPRDDLSEFDAKRADLLNGIQWGLHSVYDWVLQTDADELVCYDAERFGSLQDLLLSSGNDPVLTALGMDLVEVDGEAPLGDDPVFLHRRHVVMTGHYSKACIARRPIRFRRHGVEVRKAKIKSFPYRLVEGLYLVHLKYANVAALGQVDLVRQAIATGEGQALPGDAWKKPDVMNARFFQQFADKTELDWRLAEAKAFGQLAQDPVRTERGIIRARSLRFDHRTQLPDWFQRQ